MAARVALDPMDPVDVLDPGTEYACQVELSLSAGFEGSVDKDQLLSKMKSALVASIKESMTEVAREFDLRSTGADVRPLRFECAVNDQGTDAPPGLR